MDGSEFLVIALRWSPPETVSSVLTFSISDILRRSQALPERYKVSFEDGTDQADAEVTMAEI